jgi:hypothetical protein
MNLLDKDTTDIGDGQILHPGSRQLFRHWEMLRAERPCPTREEFSLVSIKEIVPDLLIIDRDHLRNTLKYRLSGTRVCALFNRNLTNSSVFEGWDAFESDVISRHLMTVLNQLQPAVLRMRLTTDRGQVVAAELLALPVQMRGSQRIQIIAGLFPFRGAQTLGHSAIISREMASARVIWTEHHEPLARVSPDVAPPIRNAMRAFRLIEGGKVD